MKGYVGRRDFDGVKVYVVTEKALGGLDREPLKHVVLHSPDGFEWGYLGSGPADLALSILVDYFEKDQTRAELYHQAFKEMFVAKWEKEGWTITSVEIYNFITDFNLGWHKR